MLGGSSDEENEMLQIETKKKRILNFHLSKLELAVYDAIKYDDADKLMDLGVAEQTNINFKIEMERNRFYPTIMFCASLGLVDCLKVILQNRNLDIDAIEEKSGTNAFWIAAFFGRGECMQLLAQAHIDILNRSKLTNMNALHIALQRKQYRVAKMLIKSGFPLNDLMKGGISPLILCAHDKKAH